MSGWTSSSASSNCTISAAATGSETGLASTIKGAKIGAFNELRNQVPVAAVLADIANSDDALMGYSAQGSVFGEETGAFSARLVNLHRGAVARDSVKGIENGGRSTLADRLVKPVAISENGTRFGRHFFARRCVSIAQRFENGCCRLGSAVCDGTGDVPATSEEATPLGPEVMYERKKRKHSSSGPSRVPRDRPRLGVPGWAHLAERASAPSRPTAADPPSLT